MRQLYVQISSDAGKDHDTILLYRGGGRAGGARRQHAARLELQQRQARQKTGTERSNALTQEGEQAEHGDSALRLELQQLQARRMLRTLAVVQDLADALLALNDVRGARYEAGVACQGFQRAVQQAFLRVQVLGRDFYGIIQPRFRTTFCKGMGAFCEATK